MKKLSILIFTSIFLLTGCNHHKKPLPNPAIPPKFVQTEPKFQLQGKLWFVNQDKDTLSGIDIELADTEQKREKGLMFRKSMKENRGMLFIFDKEERQTFWMKNTDIPLDIIFVNAEKMIVHIAPDCKPYSLEQIPSFEYAMYTVEVNAGYCTRHKIAVGDKIKYELLK